MDTESVYEESMARGARIVMAFPTIKENKHSDAK